MSFMKKKFQQIVSDSSSVADTRDFETITFRPTPKVAAMMEAYLLIANDPASTAFTDFISEELVIECSKNLDLAECVLDTFKEFYLKGGHTPSQGSALGYLIETGIVVVKDHQKEKVEADVAKMFEKK